MNEIEKIHPILKDQCKKMKEKEKKSIMKIIILVGIQSAVIIGIIGCTELEGFSPFICWSAKAGALFILTVTSIFLVKEIIKIFS